MRRFATRRALAGSASVFMIAAMMQAGAAPASAALIDTSGSFVTLVNDLKGLAFGSNSGLYVAPTVNQRNDFRDLAADLWDASTLADLQAMVNPAAALGYDVVRFTDAGETYFGLREQLVNNAQTVGWGSYFVLQGTSRHAIVAVPHLLFDTNTPEVGAKAFVQSDARGFMMSGAHRNANGFGTADVADPIGSIFQEVHIAWNGPNGENIAWQVHGFDLDGHLDFPADTDAVLSNGTGLVSPEIIALNDAIEDLGAQWVAYAYNTLDPLNPLNVAVNGAVDGEDFGGPDGLGATTNVQQIHSTSVGGVFVHIELEQSFRLNGPANRQLAANAIANAIIATTPLVNPIPEPTAAVVMLGLAGLLGMGRRNRA
jgi:hypothetical protein